MSTIKPLNRKELFKAAMAGEGEAPSPLNRKEAFASEIADNINEGGGGSAEIFKATYTITGQDPETGMYTATCDKTYAEVLAAFNAKKIVIATASLADVGTVNLICGALAADETLQFSGVWLLDNAFMYVSVIHNTTVTAVIIAQLQPAQS